MEAIRWANMNQLIKAYFFIPSGFKNFIENGFEGWLSLFFLYLVFSLLLAREASHSLMSGIFIFTQLIAILIILSILSISSALAVGAREPLIKGFRLTALCLPPIAFILYLMAKQSVLVFCGAYPIILFIYGSAMLGPKHRIVNAASGAITIALAIVLSYLFAVTSDIWFDQKFVLDGIRAELTEMPSYDRNEARIYKFLILLTPDLGYIPQSDEIADSLKMDRARVQNTLVKLDEKGSIVLGADREIRYAYPWAMYDQGFEVFIENHPGGGTGRPVFAASALHALASAAIFKDTKIRVISHLRDTGERLFIELINQQISQTNHPEAQIYKSDIFSEMEFYSSPSGAKSSYRGRFDSTRLLSLDRALIVAGDQMRQNTAGLF